MTDVTPESGDPTPQQPPPGEVPQVQTHFSRLRGLRGAAGPLATTVIAFMMGGLVVLVTGKNPLHVYQAVFNGTGLNWFFHPGSHSIHIPFTTTHVWFPWDTASIAAQNLEQTLLLTTPIILTGLAVAFAFRCGMFNIGGQGQYLAGSIFAVVIVLTMMIVTAVFLFVAIIIAAVFAVSFVREPRNVDARIVALRRQTARHSGRRENGEAEREK